MTKTIELTQEEFDLLVYLLDKGIDWAETNQDKIAGIALNTKLEAQANDWKTRFELEYRQLKERTLKLNDVLTKWDSKGIPPGIAKCPKSLYEWQYQSMLQYLGALEARATILGINLHKD